MKFITVCEDGKFKDKNWKVWWIRYQFLEDADWRLSIRERYSGTHFGGEAGYHDHGGVEAQGLSRRRVNLVDAAREPKKVRLEMVHTDVWGPSPVSSFLVPKFHGLEVSHCATTTLCFPKASQISHDHSFPPHHI